jgi:hypothetical protein
MQANRHGLPKQKKTRSSRIRTLSAKRICGWPEPHTGSGQRCFSLADIHGTSCSLTGEQWATVEGLFPASGSYCSFAYSALASFRIGMPGSASFQSAKKSW